MRFYNDSLRVGQLPLKKSRKIGQYPQNPKLTKFFTCHHPWVICMYLGTLDKMHDAWWTSLFPNLPHVHEQLILRYFTQVPVPWKKEAHEAHPAGYIPLLLEAPPFLHGEAHHPPPTGPE